MSGSFFSILLSGNGWTVDFISRIVRGSFLMQSVVFIDKIIHLASLNGEVFNDLVNGLKAFRIIGVHGIGFLGGSTDLLAGGGQGVGAVHKCGVGIL